MFKNCLIPFFINRLKIFNRNIVENNMKDKFEMIGKEIPNFSLPNSRSEIVSIKDFAGKKNVVVVLLRGIK